MTDNQKKVCKALFEFILKNDYPPTISEIQDILHISNPGTVHKNLKSLEDKGYIKRMKGKARGIRPSLEAKRKFLQ